MPRLRKTLSVFAALTALAGAAGLAPAPALGQSVNQSEEERLRDQIENLGEDDTQPRGLRGGLEPEQDGARARDRRNQRREGRTSRNADTDGQGTDDGTLVFEPLDPLRDPLTSPDPDRDDIAQSAEDDPYAASRVRSPDAAQTARRDPDPDDPDADDPAQSAEDDPYAALGVRMGSFLLYPELSVESEYDDNPFLSPTNPEGDWALVLTPSLQVQSDWSRHSLTATLSGERSYHERFPSEDEETYSAGLSGQLDIRHNTYLAAAANYSRFLEERSSTDFPAGASERTTTRNQAASLEGNHSFNRVTLTLRGELFEEDFDDGTTEAGAPINNDDRDYTERRVTGRVAYEFQPGVAAFVEASVNERDFAEAIDDDGTRNGSDGYDVQGGVSLALTGKLTGEISAGYALQTPDDVTLTTIDGLIFNAGLEWRATGLTTVRFDAASEVAETTIIGSAGSIVRSALLSVEHRPRHHIIVGASLGYEEEKFSGGDDVDEDLEFGLTGEYIFARGAALTAAYSYQDSTSSTPGSDYSANQFRLGVRVRR